MNFIITILILWLYPFKTTSISTGDTFPSSGANVTRAGGPWNTWTNAGNITADDGSNASVSAAAQSDYLVASGFGFSIPAGATIISVTAKIELASAFGGAKTFHAQLQDNGGSLTGSDFNQSVSGSSMTVYTYAEALWGATLTPAIINDSDFGVRFYVANISDITVDYITISVEYTNRRVFISN